MSHTFSCTYSPFEKNQILYLFLKFYLYVFCLCWVILAARAFFLVAVSGGYSLPEVLGLLIVVASLVVEHGF